MKKMIDTPWTRRQLLQTSLLGAGLTSPAMKALALSPLPQAKRVIFVYTPQGAPYEEWRPDGCDSSFTLRKASAPLEPVKQHCVFFRNFFVENGGHGITDKVLGGGFVAGRETTLDIHLGEMLSSGVLVKNLLLATHTPYGDFVSKKDFQRLAFLQSAARGYRELFGDRFADPNISSALDRKLLAQNPEARNDFDLEVDLQILLSTLALQRNATNVVTLMWGDTESRFFLPESYSAKYRNVDFHQAVASFASNEPYVYFRAYLSMKLAYLIQLLEITPDQHGKSLLDSTLVVQVTDMGDGRDHSSYNAPYMIAGGKHFFRNGLVMNVTSVSQYELMDTIAAAYGLTGVKYGKGVIDGLLKA